MNANLFHNIVNVISLVLAAGTAILMASGCITLPTGAFDCSKSWINPSYTTGVIALLQFTKLAVNITRDGITGLAKPQPPVEK